MQPQTLERMSRDIVSDAATLSDDEARYLVDAYYMMQEDRKRAHNQARSQPAQGRSDNYPAVPTQDRSLDDNYPDTNE